MLQSPLRTPRVLVFDTDTARAETMGELLRFLNYQPVIADEEGRQADGSEVAVVLGGVAKGLRRRFRRLTAERPDLPVLTLTLDDQAQETEAPDGAGTSWPLDMPVRRVQLSRLLQRAERYCGRERRQRLTGTSAAMRRVRRLIEQVADFDTSVLVTGNSGTGKELVARTIHELSSRYDRPFVPINCGAIPPDLLESELFGHEKGAFSDAVSERTGRFELAHGGTLFLDEIGDMSLAMQVKLLRVLQERAFERVGSNRTRHCDVRIIAATHRDLPSAVECGDFRQDLYYRLNVFPIEMPPLARRRSDLPELLDELLIRHQGDGQGRLRLAPEALSALAAYEWPGNVRELCNLVERLAILCPSGEVRLEDLPEKYRRAAASRTDTETGPDIGTGTGTPLVACGAVNDPAAGLSLDLRSHLQRVEKDLIRQALHESGGVVAQAARLLRMRRTTLVEKLSRLPA